MYSKSTLLAILAATATALPSQVDKRCSDSYQNPIGQEYDGKPSLAAGQSCTTSGDVGCSSGTGWTHTEGTSITVGVDVGITIEEVFSLGASVSESWTTSDSTSTTITVQCPAGGWTCGAMVTPKKRKLTGKYCGKDFEVEVNSVDTSQNKDGQAKMNFQACALATPKEGYNGVAPQNFPVCPGTTGLEGFPESGQKLNFKPGRCGVHVTQYQKKKPGDNGEDGKYHYDIDVVDNDGALIGGTQQKGLWSKDGQAIEVKGDLPNAFLIKDGAVDADPVGFEYSGFKFDTDNKINPSQPVCHRASKADGYENGNRDMDCSFAC